MAALVPVEVAVADEVGDVERLAVRLLEGVRDVEGVIAGLREIEALRLALRVGVVVLLRFGVHEFVGL